MRTPGKQCGLAATGDYSPSLRFPWLAAVVIVGTGVAPQVLISRACSVLLPEQLGPVIVITMFFSLLRYSVFAVIFDFNDFAILHLAPPDAGRIPFYRTIIVVFFCGGRLFCFRLHGLPPLRATMARQYKAASNPCGTTV